MLDNNETESEISTPEAEEEATSEVSSETEQPEPEENPSELDDENEEEEEESQDDHDKNHEALEWVKKRLAQKDRQIKRRLRDKEKELEVLRQQVASIYQPQQEYTAPQGQIYDPTSGQYVDEDSVDGKFIKKFQQLKEVEVAYKQKVEAETKQKTLRNTIEDLKDKYDDLEEVIQHSVQNLTAPMSEMMLNYPNSVETFYDLAKNNPEKLEEISKMSPFQQIKAINFIEFQKDTSVHQKLKSNAPKPVTPVKPSTARFVDTSSYEAILKRQKEEQKRRYG